jgi:hypothetical protein
MVGTMEKLLKGFWTQARASGKALSLCLGKTGRSWLSDKASQEVVVRDGAEGQEQTMMQGLQFGKAGSSA